MLKVGDKVIVRSFDDMAKKYGQSDGIIGKESGFMPGMRYFCGKIVTIVEAAHITYNFYRISEDNGRYYWNDYMLIPTNSILYFLEKRG